MGEKAGQQEKRKALLALPNSQLFEVHGSKLELHPVCHLGQASELGITHGVFLLGVRKDPFNGLLAPLVQFLVLRRITGVVRQLLVVLPDMPVHRLYTVLGVGAQLSSGTAGADLRVTLVFPAAVPVGGAVSQHLELRAEHTVIVLVVNVFPPFMSALHGLRALVGCGQDPFVVKYFLADVRSFIRGVGNHGLHFREGCGHFVIDFIKRHTVMYIAGRYHRFQHKAALVTCRVGFICKLPFVLTFHKQAAVRVSHAPRHRMGLVLLPPGQLLF